MSDNKLKEDLVKVYKEWKDLENNVSFLYFFKIQKRHIILLMCLFLYKT